MQKISIVCVGIAAIFVSTYLKSATPSQFTLNTTAFQNKDRLAAVYTCDGRDISPELHWINIPTQTKSLTLIVTDPDAPSGTFYHWVVYNIPTDVTTLPRDSRHLPKNALAAKNSWGNLQYNGPCPPKGSTHTYVFTLYAIDVQLNLPIDTDGTAVIGALKNHVLDKSALTTRYDR